MAKDNFKLGNDPGLGERFLTNANRIINKDGSFSVKRHVSGHRFINLYQELISMSWGKFLAFVTLFYFLVNALFAALYLLIGVEDLSGLKHQTLWNDFWQAFYFSIQTFTTVGYGAISPQGTAINFVAAIDALCGLLAFALITGLLYGRFSKPNINIRFSKQALLAPFRDGRAFMFRIVNMRNNVLMEMEANVMLMLYDKDENGEIKRKYYPLKLQTDFIYFFPMNWTIVHPIDENSPLNNRSLNDLKRAKAEFLILLKGFDDTFSQVVHKRYSYTAEEVFDNQRFVPMFTTTETGDVMVEIDDIDRTEKVT